MVFFQPLARWGDPAPGSGRKPGNACRAPPSHLRLGQDGRVQAYAISFICLDEYHIRFLFTVVKTQVPVVFIVHETLI